MKPKEKAIELYNKFRDELPVLSCNSRAKRMAKICVDEIILTCKLNDEEFYVQTPYYEGYWLDVKDEITKL